MQVREGPRPTSEGPSLSVRRKGAKRMGPIVQGAGKPPTEIITSCSFTRGKSSKAENHQLPQSSIFFWAKMAGAQIWVVQKIAKIGKLQLKCAFWGSF